MGTGQEQPEGSGLCTGSGEGKPIPQKVRARWREGGVVRTFHKAQGEWLDQQPPLQTQKRVQRRPPPGERNARRPSRRRRTPGSAPATGALPCGAGPAATGTGKVRPSLAPSLGARGPSQQLLPSPSARGHQPLPETKSLHGPLTGVALRTLSARPFGTPRRPTWTDPAHHSHRWEASWGGNRLLRRARGDQRGRHGRRP